MSSVVKDPSPVEDYYTIDTDFHLQIDHEQLYEYVEDAYLRKRLESDGTPPIPYTGGNPFYSWESRKSKATTQGAAVTTDEIKNVMDDWGLDIVTVSPLPNTFMANGRYPRIQKACIRAYHDYLLDRVVDMDEGIYALAIVNDFDAEWTAGELERIAGEDSIVGATNWVNNDTPMGLFENDAIWDVLDAHDMPIVFHQGSGGGRWDTYEQHYESAERLISGQFYQVSGNVMNMIMTGLFDKYPDLDVLIQEQGTAWIPYMANHADQLYEEYSEDAALTERMYADLEQRSLERKPSEYLYENVNVTTQPIALPPRGDHVRSALEIRRAKEMFLFSTDWPHSTVDTPDWVNHSQIDAELREHILHKNAERIFDYASA